LLRSLTLTRPCAAPLRIQLTAIAANLIPRNAPLGGLEPPGPPGSGLPASSAEFRSGALYHNYTAGASDPPYQYSGRAGARQGNNEKRRTRRRQCLFHQQLSYMLTIALKQA
jgi:hypothetical protein